MKIDPTFKLILTKNSWPLVLPIVDINGQSMGLAVYTDRTRETIYYTYEGKRFKLVAVLTKS